MAFNPETAFRVKLAQNPVGEKKASQILLLYSIRKRHAQLLSDVPNCLETFTDDTILPILNRTYK